MFLLVFGVSFFVLFKKKFVLFVLGGLFFN